MDEITRTIEARRWHKDDRQARMEKELLIAKEVAPDMTDKARAYAEIIDSIINGYGIAGPYAIYTEDGHDYLCVSEDDCTKPCEDFTAHTDNGYLCVQLDAVNKDCGAMTSGTAGASNPVYSDKPKKSQYKVTYVKDLKKYSLESLINTLSRDGLNFGHGACDYTHGKEWSCAGYKLDQAVRNGTYRDIILERLHDVQMELIGDIEIVENHPSYWNTVTNRPAEGVYSAFFDADSSVYKSSVKKYGEFGDMDVFYVTFRNGIFVEMEQQAHYSDDDDRDTWTTDFRGNDEYDVFLRIRQHFSNHPLGGWAKVEWQIGDVEGERMYDEGVIPREIISDFEDLIHSKDYPENLIKSKTKKSTEALIYVEGAGKFFLLTHDGYPSYVEEVVVHGTDVADNPEEMCEYLAEGCERVYDGGRWIGNVSHYYIIDNSLNVREVSKDDMRGLAKSNVSKSEEYLVLITFDDGSTGITPLFPDYQSADKECSDIRWNLDGVRNAEVFSMKQAVEFFGFDENELRSLANSAN